MKKIYNSVVCVVLAAALCLGLVACGGASEKNDIWENATYNVDTEFGTGSKVLYVEVKAEDKSVLFTVRSDKKTVGDALVEYNLISGENGPYGLYVKTVNGIKADYNTNKAYWAFSKNGEVMVTGVDGTEFADGEHYEFVYTK